MARGRRNLPDILAISDEFRAALQAREDYAFAQMSDAYVQIERRLLAEMEALLRDAADKKLTRGQVVRLQRFKDLVRQVETEADRYAAFTSQLITNEQRYAIELGLVEAERLTAAALPEGLKDLARSWNRLPVSALQSMIGFAGDGSPLMPAMMRRFGSSAPAVKDALLKGVSLGWHPTKTVRELRPVLTNDLLDSALTWARTEQIRAHREASRRSYEANGDIIRGWQRIATKDDRTCAACIMLDGTVYPKQEDGSMPPMDDHVRGRCRMAPLTVGYGEILGIDAGDLDKPTPYQTGREWFEAKTPAKQREWMDSHIGKGAYDAWRAGTFKLDHIPQRHESKEWGPSYGVRSLGELLKRGK